MYIVVSTWEILPGKREEAERIGLEMRDILRAIAGIDMLRRFEFSDNQMMVIMGYTDEATYNRIISDPNGPFETKVKELGLENVMTWKQSWRGEEAE